MSVFRFIRVTPVGEPTKRECWAADREEARQKLGSPHVVSAASLALPNPFAPPPAKRCIVCKTRPVKPGVSSSLCQPCKVAYTREWREKRRAQFAASKRKQRASATFRATENAKAKDRMRTLRAS